MNKFYIIQMLFFVFLYGCKSPKNITKGKKENIQIEPETITPDGFTKSLYMSHGNYVTQIEAMEFRFMSLSKSVKVFTYRYKLPSYIDKSDTLIFNIDFEDLDKSYYCKKDFYIAYEKYNPISKKDSITIKLRLDTFKLVFIDSIHTVYENTIYPIYRFDSFIGDFQCNTFFVNDSMGVFKRYGLTSDDCVEHDYLNSSAKYKLQVFLINELGMRKEFHKACPTTKLWIGGGDWPH